MVGVNARFGVALKAQKKLERSLKSGADVGIGTSHALEGKDVVCGSLDVIGSVSSAVGLVVGNIPATKHLTFLTGSVTVGCRTVRYYCKNYGTFWGWTVAAGQGVSVILNCTHLLSKSLKLFLFHQIIIH